MPYREGPLAIIQSSSISQGQSFVQKYKYYLALLAFIVVFVAASTYMIGYMSLQWDEMPHLFGATLLSRGDTWSYMTTYAYYPPIFDLVTTGYFAVFGVSEIAGRMVAVSFAALGIWLLFEFTKRAYGQRNALLAAAFLGTMPGFFWLSRVTMLETMLIFFFTLAMFAFYMWLSKPQSNRALVLSGLALAIGVLAKYQIIVAALAMLLSILFLSRKHLKGNLLKFVVIGLIVFAVVMPWFIAIYHYNGMTKFETIQYVMTEGGQDRPAYSNRFQPIPVYYLVEMTWPFNDITVHPIALPIFILGLAGLGLFAYRRKKQDIFFLTWFLVIYVFFTLISNRQWRYVTPLFPILAVSAASFIMFVYGKVERWQPQNVKVKPATLKKLASVFTIAVVIGAIAYSAYNAYQMTERDQINIPIKEATAYLASNLGANESAVLVCSYNLLSQDMFRFYLPANISWDHIWQYPALPVDSFTPNFNASEFVQLCQERHVKYIILYDYGNYQKFFNSTLDYTQVLTLIYSTNKFGDPQDQPFWGDFNGWMGHRIYLVRFLD